MADDPKMGYKITAKVTALKGTCLAGHKVGDTFELNCFDTCGLCGFFYHTIFADLQTLQFGGNTPWWEGNVVEVGCPDLFNQMTMVLEKSERS